MKIVRFSQNGHAPRLGCLVGNDRVMDLAAGAAAYLTKPFRAEEVRAAIAARPETE